MSRFLTSLSQSRALLRDFVSRDLRARYVGSTMGFFWSVIFPLINLFVFLFVFRIILGTRWGDEQGAIEVSLVMLAGIMVWTGFAEAISRSTGAVVANANLVQKVVFPSAVLPTYITVSAFVNMSLGLPIVIGTVLWFGHLSSPKAGLEVSAGIAQNGIYEGYELNEEVTAWPRFHIALERAWKEPKTFQIEYGGTATRGVDYLAEYDELTIPAGTARSFVPIIPLRDNVIEGDETVVIRVVDSDGMELFADAATFQIHDNQYEDPAELTRDLGHDTAAYVSPTADQYHNLSLGLPLLTVPFLLALLAVATVGIGAFFAAFNLYWRDTTHLISVALLMWMFGTPIFYPDFLIPEGFRWMLMLNPMHWFIDMFRDVTLFAQWPDLKMLGLFTAFAAGIFWLGTRFFSKHEPQFADLI